MKDILIIKKTFSIRAIIKQAFEVFKREWKVLVGASVVYLLISLLTGGDEETMSAAESIIALLINIVLFYLYFGIIRISLRMLRGESFAWEHLKTPGKKVWSIVLTGLLYLVGPLVLVVLVVVIGGIGLFMSIGMGAIGIGTIITLFILGILLLVYSIRFGMWIYFVIDRDYKPVAALKASYKATAGSTLRLIAFIILTAFAFVIGMIPVGLGLLIVLPMYVLCQSAIYERLSKHMLGESSEFPVEQPSELPASKPIETDIDIKPVHHDAPVVEAEKEETKSE
jgi:hypothetical protein